MEALTEDDRREARLSELRAKLAASERMGLSTRVAAIAAEIARLEAGDVGA
ncbi:MAG: hypothetical protein JWR85_3580 [Marmoricola sp.]|nr:hypothetical protein [Marmoricola sp.]